MAAMSLLAAGPGVDAQAFVLQAANGNTACTTSGNCFAERSGSYFNNERCTWRVTRTTTLFVRCFSTESGFDRLTVNGRSYSGSFGPSNVRVSAGSLISWRSDFSIVRDGFDICASGFSQSPSTCFGGSGGNVPPPPLAPPPPTFSSSVGTSGSSGSSGSADEQPSGGDTAAAVFKGLAAMLMLCICGCCIAKCCTAPEETINKVPVLSPGVGVGALIIIFAIAIAGTTNTIVFSADNVPGTNEVESGIFKFKVDIDNALVSVSETKDQECNQDSTDRFAVFNGCFAGPETDCCKSIAQKCRSQKAYVMFGLFLTVAATALEPIRVLLFSAIPKRLPAGCAIAAAVFYVLCASTLIGTFFGLATFKDEDENIRINEEATCGYTDIPNVSVRLSSGFSLLVFAYILSLVQAGLYYVWTRDEDDGGAGNFRDREARSRADSAGMTSVNPVYKWGVENRTGGTSDSSRKNQGAGPANGDAPDPEDDMDGLYEESAPPPTYDETYDGFEEKPALKKKNSQKPRYEETPQRGGAPAPAFHLDSEHYVA